MLKDVLDRIEARLEALGMTATGASRQAGLSLDAIRNMRRKVLAGDINAGVSSRTIEALAPVLETTTSWLLTGDAANNERIKGDPVSIIPGGSLITQDKSLPVYPAAMGGDGHVIITFDPIEYVKRPAVLEHVKDGYGVLIVGESMIPAYRPGDTALINPRLPPQRETDVVLFHTPPNDEAECIIKQLNGFNDHIWHLEQFNPAKTFDEHRKEWPICHRVVGKYNRR